MKKEEKAAAGTATLNIQQSKTYPIKSSKSSRKLCEGVAKRRADIPKRYRALYDRCIAGIASPREALKMQCLECWSWVQTETALCDNITCPLYAYRPYQKATQVPDRTTSATQEQRTKQRGYYGRR